MSGLITGLFCNQGRPPALKGHDTCQANIAIEFTHTHGTYAHTHTSHFCSYILWVLMGRWVCMHRMSVVWKLMSDLLRDGQGGGGIRNLAHNTQRTTSTFNSGQNIEIPKLEVRGFHPTATTMQCGYPRGWSSPNMDSLLFSDTPLPFQMENKQYLNYSPAGRFSPPPSSNLIPLKIKDHYLPVNPLWLYRYPLCLS